KRDISGDLPHAAPFHIPGAAATTVDVLADAPALDLLELLEEVEVDPVLVDHVAAGVRRRDRGSAELLDLLDRVDRDVARSGHDRLAPVEAVVACRQHLLRKDRGPVPGGLLADE